MNQKRLTHVTIEVLDWISISWKVRLHYVDTIHKLNTLKFHKTYNNFSFSFSWINDDILHILLHILCEYNMPDRIIQLVYNNV